MVSASTIVVCALSDQVKKYRARVVGSHHHHHAGKSDAKSNNSHHPIPTLLLLCLKVISDRFCFEPKAQNVPRKFLPDVMARLPLDLDVGVSAPHLFLEKYLQDLLEDFDAKADYPDHLVDVVKAYSEFVFSLEIRQLLSHLDLNELCSRLKNLTKLQLTYDVKQISMKISDATNLSHIMKNTKTLTTLALPTNLLDDDLLRMLMTGFVKTNTLTALDLSRNKLTNHGARLLSKLLGPESVLTTLRVADNQIHAEGGRYLSRGLKHNTSLPELDLRLNRFTDDGGRVLLEGLAAHYALTLLEGLAAHYALTLLNLSSKMLGTETASALADPHTALRSIDLSSNALKEADGVTLALGLQPNATVVALDLRLNSDIPVEAECLLQIAQKLCRNEVELKSGGGGQQLA